MKKHIIIIAMALFCASCAFDDSELVSELDRQEAQISALEESLSSLNSSISALRALADAINGKDFITGVDKGNGFYTIHFLKGEDVVIKDGENALCPVIGLVNEDGVLYWTIDGKKVLDDKGNPFRLTGEDGSTPNVIFIGGKLYYRFGDRGQLIELGPGTMVGSDAVDYSIITGVELYSDYIKINVGGQWIDIPVCRGGSSLSLRDEISGTIDIIAGNYECFFLENTSSYTDFFVKYPFGWYAEVFSNFLKIVAPDDPADDIQICVIGVKANGTTDMLVLDVRSVEPTKMYYTAEERLWNSENPATAPTWSFGGANIVRDDYDAASGKGCLVFDGVVYTIDAKALFYRPFTSIDIPETVESIGEAALYSSMVVDEYSGKFTYADGQMVICDNTLIASAGYHPNTSLVVPEGVKRLGDYSIAWSEAEEVVLPESLDSIGRNVFYFAPHTKEVTIPKGVKSIENGSFQFCDELETIYIEGKDVKFEYSGQSFLKNCPAMKAVYVPRDCVDLYKQRVASSGKSDLIRPIPYKRYEKVVAEPEDWSGSYLIVCPNRSNALDGSLATLDATNNVITVTFNEDGDIDWTESLEASSFTVAPLEEATYTVKSSSGYYISGNSSSPTNALYTATAIGSDKSRVENFISYDTTNNCITIASAAGNTLYYNTSARRFRYYKPETYANSGKDRTQLYKFVCD